MARTRTKTGSARKSGGSSRAASKRGTAKKSTAKKSTAKRATAKKTTARKSAATRSTAKRGTARKSTAKRSAAKRATRRASVSFESLQDVLVHEIEDLYSAERQLVRALPKLAAAASNPQLRAALEDHLEETRRQVERLDRVFEQLGEGSKSETCEAMQGLVEEGEEIVAAKGDPDAKDAALIAAAQRVEHYEIAAYGTARTLAADLGLSEARDLLNDTLSEESMADELLTRIATGGAFRSGINAEALT